MSRATHSIARRILFHHNRAKHYELLHKSLGNLCVALFIASLITGLARYTDASGVLCAATLLTALAYIALQCPEKAAFHKGEAARILMESLMDLRPKSPKDEPPR